MNLTDREIAAWVGIDWADEEHTVAMAAAKQLEDVQRKTLKQSPEAIDEWALELQRRFPGKLIAVCLEQSKGSLIYALMKYDFLVLYPINPKQLARYREAFNPSGAKDDPTDADLLLDLVMRHHHQLRQWKPDDADTRLIRMLAEDRRDLVDRRTAFSNRLKSRLKQYFPLLLQLCGNEISPLACELLQRWGSLEELQQGSLDEIRGLLRGFMRSYRTVEERLVLIPRAIALTMDRAIVEAGRRHAQALAAQILQLDNAISQYDVRLKEIFARHPLQPIFSALPGAGPVMAPRLLAVLGGDRDRYQTATEVQCSSGIAPVTRRSGKTTHVQRRWACPRFVLQTFHEYANCSRNWSPWARAYYRYQRANGQKHNAAVRALAFKWIRIIFRCWKDGTLYNEVAYVEQLRSKGSPCLQYLGT
jgi:transposase